MTFDAFACIDWSGAKGEGQKGIALALCEKGRAAPRLIDPPGRLWSRAAILDWLEEQAQAGRRILIGMDISPALPFIDAGAYFPGWHASPADAPGLWQMVDEMCADEDHFGANAFIAHEQAARHFRQQGQCGDLFGIGRGRLRVCEFGQKDAGLAPYSCFNLVGAAQVGKSSLTAMRLLHRLRGRIPVWPFDPLPTHGPLIVEIYTSLAARHSGVMPGNRTKIKDGALLDAALACWNSAPHTPLAEYSDHATDAILTSAWLRAKAVNALLWVPKRLTPEISSTEGWTFGVI